MPAQPDEIWDAIRGELRRETPDFKFHIWLEPLSLAAIEGSTVYVRAPEHIRTSVAERYLPLLRRAAAAGFHDRALVEVVGDDWERPAGGGPPGTNGATAGAEPPERGGHLVEVDARSCAVAAAKKSAVAAGRLRASVTGGASVVTTCTSRSR